MLFTKDPDATLDYQVNWGMWLGEDIISNSTWEVPIGITKGSESFDGTTATIWLSGGTIGQRYAITNTIATVGTRGDDRTFHILIADR